jgi:hypothetical protein
VPTEGHIYLKGWVYFNFPCQICVILTLTKQAQYWPKQTYF